MLAREVIRPAETKPKTYTILGASAGSYRVRSDVWEIQNLMREAFGWECIYTMGLESTVSEAEAAGGSALHLVIRGEALEAAGMLKETCGIPYHYGAPYGYAGTLRWLQQIAEIIGEEINPALIARLKKKQLAIVPMGGPMAMMMRQKASASIQGDYDMLLGMRQALAEMDIEAVNLICSHSLKAVQNPDAAVQHYAKEKERIDLMKTLHGQWCLGSDEMAKYCTQENYFTLASAPFLSKRQTASHLPFMGEKGMDYLVELKNEFFEKFDL